MSTEDALNVICQLADAATMTGKQHKLVAEAIKVLSSAIKAKPAAG
jgi:hypothetical protein